MTIQYELSSKELAHWIEAQGLDRWWTVDGDPLLTSRLAFPCPGDELAEELRRMDRPLLVLAEEPWPWPPDRQVTRLNLGELACRLGDNVRVQGDRPSGTEDRFFVLRWRDSGIEWLLLEDQETTERSREEAVAQRGGND